MLSLKHKIIVDLVTDHRDPMLQTDLAHSGQFFPRKYSSGGIMGIAQKEQLDLMLHDFLLEILQVNVIAVVCSQIQIIADNDSVRYPGSPRKTDSTPAAE